MQAIVAKFAIVGLCIVSPSSHMVARIDTSLPESMTGATRDRAALRVVLTLGQLGVSPEFRLRPSLSVDPQGRGALPPRQGVAGV